MHDGSTRARTNQKAQSASLEAQMHRHEDERSLSLELFVSSDLSV